MSLQAAFAKQREANPETENVGHGESKKERQAAAKQALMDKIAQGEKVWRGGRWCAAAKKRGGQRTMKQFAFGGACYVGVAKSTFIWGNGTGGIDTYFRSTPLINQTWNPPKPKGKRSFLGPGDSQAKKRAKGTSPNIQWTPNQKIHAMELWLKRIAKRRIESYVISQ